MSIDSVFNRACRRRNQEKVDEILGSSQVGELDLAKALAIAAEMGLCDAILKLVALGADVKETDDSADLHPICCAAQNGHVEAIRLLAKLGADFRAGDEWMDPLYQAVSNGHPAAVRLLVELGADPLVRLPEGDWGGMENCTLLHMAGDAETARFLVECGLDVEARSDAGMRPLHAAALHDHANVFDTLLKLGADVQARTDSGRTVLHFANGFGVLRRLATLDVDVEARTRDGKTPIFHVARGDNAELATILVAMGADPTATAVDGSSLFHDAATSWKSDRVLGFLYDCGVPIDARRREGSTPLHLAVHDDTRDHELLRFLLAHGADVNAVRFDGCTPLDLAKAHRMELVVDLLEAHGAREGAGCLLSNSEDSECASQGDPDPITNEQVENSPVEKAGLERFQRILSSQVRKPDVYEVQHAEDGWGGLPLHRAIAHRRIQEVLDLLESGVEPASVDADGNTALHIAARSGFTTAIPLLRRYRNDLESRNASGETPLFLAALYGQADAARMLLDLGADVEASDGSATALHAASGRCERKGSPREFPGGFPMAIPVLVEYGGDIESQDEDGDTPLHNAAASGEFVTLRTLVECGADIEARNGWGGTPLHLAVVNGSTYASQTLLELGAKLNSRDDQGDSPLHAAMHKDIWRELNRGKAIASLLIDAGADPWAKNEAGQTCIDMACNIEAANWLKECVLERELRRED